MEVHLTPDLEAKLSRVAEHQGREPETLVKEAIERLIEYDDWFLDQVQKGIAAADRCEFTQHNVIRKLIDSRYPG